MRTGEHISRTTAATVMRVICGCGSVVLWRRCDMLRTSGVMDAIIFAHIGLGVGDAKSCILNVTQLRASGLEE